MNDPQATDAWSEWLLKARYGSDATLRGSVQAQIATVVDKVLDAARLRPHMTMLDIGSGDGVVAWRAIERAGPTLQVIISDISAPLLQHAEAVARHREVREQCRFLQCNAANLQAIADASLDAVTSRAAIAYEADKPQAFREIARVLRPGARVSMAEPVLQDDALETAAMRAVLEQKPADAASSLLALLHRSRAAQFPDTQEAILRTPHTAFSERDLVRIAVDAGFVDIHMEFHIDMFPSIYPSWEVYLATSPHPLAPTLGAILAEHFTPEERTRFEAMMRPRIENPATLSTSRVAYLSARKPA